MNAASVTIRRADQADFPAIWMMFEPIVAAGDTYAIAPDIDYDTAHSLWMDAPLVTYVAQLNDDIRGTFYLKPNQAGGGGHVCNCGYMVAESARGQGLATAMCEFSQSAAVELGFKAMQFNHVVSTNHGAIRLWQKLGFDIVGTLPRAFDHPQQGLIDAHVMYKWLAAE